MARVGDWKALGRAVTSRRVELGYDRRDDFAATAGIGSRTVGEIERGEEKGYRDSLIAKLEKALQWPPGAVRSIVAGGDPPAPGSRIFYGDPAQQPPTDDPDDDGWPFSLRPDAVVVRAARLLGDDSPLDGRTRQMLAVAVANVFDLVDRPSRAGEDLRDREAMAMFQETIEAVNKGRLREPRGADL